jgi:hypothetical protein
MPARVASCDMGVSINGKPLIAKRGGRGIAFDQSVLRFADAILVGQSKGHVHARELARWLNDQEIPSPNGGPWSASTVYRMLFRAEKLGVPVVRRSRSDAASRRKVIRRSKDAIAAADRLAIQKLASKLRQTDTAITS